MVKPVRILTTAFLLAILAFPRMLPAAEGLVFGVHPFQKPAELVKTFKPLTDYLSRELGTQVQLVIGKSYEDVMRKYESGEIDLGFLGPSLFAQEAAKGGVRPLARIVVNGKGNFQGVIVVRQESPVKRLADLRGKSFAFGDPESTLSHYVPHYLLLQQGIRLKDLSKHAFVGNHDNVALNVLQGNFDAGGLKPETARKYMDRGLKVLVESEPVPEHVFVASSRLDEKTFKRVKGALLKADLQLLQGVNGSITGLEEAQSGDYDGLRKLMAEVDTKDPAGK